MSGPSLPAPAPPARGLFTQYLVPAAGFVVLSFACIHGFTWAAGFGHDLHVFRILAAIAVLAVAAFLFVSPGRSLQARVGAAAGAAVFGTFAWWVVPCRPAGMNLLNAVANRDALRMTLAHPQYSELVHAKKLLQQVEDFERDYPSLAREVRPDLALWAKGEAESVVEKYREMPFNKFASGRDIRTRAAAFAAVFPEYREMLDDEFHQWSARACRTRMDELDEMTPGNWAAFDQSAGGRRALVLALPEYRNDLVDAERAWVARSVGHVVDQALSTLEANPRQARQLCKEANDRLRALKCLDTRADRFRVSREGLFTVALEAVRVEIINLIRAEDYENAFTVAVRHGFEWLAAAQRLGPKEMASLDELRESTRHLSERARLAGGPIDAAPEPRGREAAPEPRPRPPANGDTQSISFLDDPTDTKKLEDALDLIAARKYQLAIARLQQLGEDKKLSGAILKALPGLIADLRDLESLLRFTAADPERKRPSLPIEQFPALLKRQKSWLELLRAVATLLESPQSWTEPQANKLLGAVATDFGEKASSDLRLELSARLFLAGRPKEATALIRGESPGENARQVLSDLRTLIIGGGTLKNQQVARLVPEAGLNEMPGVLVLIPTSRRADWQRPTPPTEGATTLAKLEIRCREEAGVAAVKEASALTAKITKAAEQLRKELGK